MELLSLSAMRRCVALKGAVGRCATSASKSLNMNLSSRLAGDVRTVNGLVRAVLIASQKLRRRRPESACVSSFLC